MALTIPEDELFWRQVRNAVAQCEKNHERKVEFTLGERKATVTYSENVFNKTAIVIMIESVPVDHKAALIVP